MLNKRLTKTKTLTFIVEPASKNTFQRDAGWSAQYIYLKKQIIYP
jgi:hypothetical protein